MLHFQNQQSQLQFRSNHFYYVNTFNASILFHNVLNVNLVFGGNWIDYNVWVFFDPVEVLGDTDINVWFPNAASHIFAEDTDEFVWSIAWGRHGGWQGEWSAFITLEQ